MLCIFSKDICILQWNDVIKQTAQNLILSEKKHVFPNLYHYKENYILYNTGVARNDNVIQQ